MRARGTLAFLLRESRGARARMLFSTLCVAIGVAAVVGVASTSAALQEGLRARSRELLAADFEVESRQGWPAGLEAALENLAPGAESLRVRELATMAGAYAREADAPEGARARPQDREVARSRLCELKVVEPGYPYFGTVELEPAGSLHAHLGPKTAVIAPELLAALELDVGDVVRIGGADFLIAAAVLSEPDRLDFQITLGPRVFLSPAGFERTSLLGVGNRVKYRTLVKLPRSLPEEPLERLGDDLLAALEGASYLDVDTHFDSQPGVRRGVDRFTSFLGLVALLSLILGGIGVAQVTRSWVASRTTAIAVWKCIGLVPREILTLYLVQSLLFALVGSLVGALVGASLPLFLPRLAPDFLPPHLVHAWQPLSIARGLVLGVGIAALFTLPALTALWRVPAARVLQSAAVALPVPLAVRVVTLALLGTGLLASAWLQGGRFEWAAWFAGGLAAAALLLFLGARLLLRLARLLPRHAFGPTLTHGIAALARPGSGTVGAIVALGLGTGVVASMTFVQGRLSAELAGALPHDAPSVFLVDVQPDQLAGVEALLANAGAAEVDSTPVVMARLAAIDGRPVERLVEEDRRDVGPDRSRWRLTREQRLTWFDELPRSNRLVDGALWEAADEVREISLEEEYAEGLDARLGTELTFDVQGVALSFVVTSIRAITWESFEINFFLAVEPGLLDDAPAMHLAAARVPPENEDALQARLVQDYPNVTLVRIRAILEKVAALLERIAFGVRLLGSFTVLAGIAILAGAVAASQLERGREAALLKTLGVTRAGVAALFATEFALSGLVAGVLGAACAYALAWGFLEEVLELEARLALGSVSVQVLLTALLAVVAGVSASLRALQVRPVRTLR